MALLDTTFLIDLMKEAKKRHAGPATVKLDELIRRGEALRIAVFTIGELYVGVAKGTQPTRERAKVEGALQPFDIVPFEANTARIFGGVVGELEKQGQPISDMDALIASAALENDELLVTRNVGHFQRVPGLRVEGY
ncbi:MAG: type II toxin-antitoxin system VapC family toxin [Planctomycetia bacterium]|nr:type II toxin-antitoxin system VapC family toxin [Planctomycetia bacterium]